MFEHHMLIWFISGETKIVQAEGTYMVYSRRYFLIPREPTGYDYQLSKDGVAT